jgi:hypothetical protein
MNKLRWISGFTCLVLLLSAGECLAHRGGGHGRHFRGGNIGFYWGGPMWGSGFWPYYGWPSPYYYGPPMAVPVPVPTQPPTYIERGQDDDDDRPLPSGYWYYCANPPGYYPDVTDCPVGWQQVPPR